MLNIFISKVKYAFYIMLHPFKGFWNLKREKIGTVSSASFYLVLLSLVSVASVQLTGFIVNYNNTLNTNLFYVAIRVVLIFMVWVLANWSVTTLIEGEGKLKDIYIATAYALVPYICSAIINIVLSNVIVLQEATFYYLIQSIGLIWSGLLLLIGLLTIHQLSMMKTIVTVIVAVIAMIIIMFLVLMMVSLTQQIINFVSLILQEVML